MKTQTDQNITKNKRILVPLIIASIIFSVALFLLILGLLVGFLYVKAKPKRELQTKLDLGEKYVNEMDYENAILTYKEAIEIDPKCVEAYLGIGNAYLKTADSLMENGFLEETIDYLDEGISELETGYNNTQSEEIADKINELKDSINNIINTHEDTEDFLDEGIAEDFLDEDTEEFAEEDISGISDNVYLDTIKKYYDAIIKNVGWDGWEPTLGDYYFFGYGETGYLIEDINGDEIPELIIGFTNSNDSEWAEGVILALYTYKDGEVINVLYSYERALYKYHEDGVFEYIWNGSSEDNGTEYYRFPDEEGIKLTKIEESANAGLKIFQYESFREFTYTETEESKEYMAIDVRSLPGGLEDFLNYLMWTTSDYDCESKEKTGEVVEYITAHPSRAFSDLYSDYIYVPQYEDRYSDTSFFVPMDEYGWSGYFVYDSDGIDWILKNIYNFSDERILEIKEPDFCTDTFKDENKEARKFFFYDSGKYWSYTGGIGGPGWIINIKRAEVLGNYYNVEYEVIDDYEGGSTTIRYAVMEYKIIDGKGYWSIYKASEEPLFEFSEDINE